MTDDAVRRELRNSVRRHWNYTYGIHVKSVRAVLHRTGEATITIRLTQEHLDGIRETLDDD